MRDIVRVRDLAALSGECVQLHGWVSSLRQSRSMQFLRVRDRTGEVQATHRRSDSPRLEALIALVTRESAVRVTGTVRPLEARPLEARSPGEVEIGVEDLEVLAPADSPAPLVGDGDPERRLDYRYLDLRSPERFLLFEVQTTFEAAVRRFLGARGFVEIHSPKICAGGSESGADVFSLPYFATTAYLVQSTQFYKQMAMAAGFERAFEIGPIFRAERSHTPRHATEFTCIDFEISWIDSHEELMSFEEELLVETLGEVRHMHGRDVKRVFGVDVEVPDAGIPRVPLQLARDLARQADPAAAERARADRLSHLAELEVSRHAREVYGSSFVFVTGFPADERPFYHMRDEAGPTDASAGASSAGDSVPLTRSFDLLWRGIEITTGGQREHRYERLLAQAEQAGLDQQILAAYLKPFYLEMFRWGTPPHGGFGIGLERFTMALTAQPSIRETAFVFRGPGRLVP